VAEKYLRLNRPANLFIFRIFIRRFVTWAKKSKL
jgi:hypothetical protein